MGKIVYIVLQRDYEYNDETYEYHGGGNAMKVYATREKAEARVEELMLNDMKKGGFDYLLEYRCFDEVFDGMTTDAIDTWGLVDTTVIYTTYKGQISRETRQITEKDLDVFRIIANDPDDTRVKMLIEGMHEPLYYIEEVEFSE